MTAACERYLPEITGAHIAYEHWHRYLFATQFVAGKRVLDIACGEGYGSSLLAERAEHVTGVDIDPEVVRRAASRYARPNLTFLCIFDGGIPIPAINGNICQPTSKLKFGKHTLVARAFDAAGNNTNSDPKTFKIVRT